MASPTLVLACRSEAPAGDEVCISWARSTFQEMADAPVDGPDMTGNLYYSRIRRVADGGLLFFWKDVEGISCTKDDLSVMTAWRQPPGKRPRASMKKG